MKDARLQTFTPERLEDGLFALLLQGLPATAQPLIRMIQALRVGSGRAGTALRVSRNRVNRGRCRANAMKTLA